jgi:hypothetical protein
MESGGVAEAAFERNVGFFVVRGAQDYCNEYKNDHWRNYAAIVAAAYTRALLEVTPTFLSQRDEGPTTASVQTEIVHNILAAQPQSANAQIPTAANHAVESVQRELGRAMELILEEDGARKLNEITRCLDTWEFARAISLAKNQEDWVEKFKSKLSKQLVRDIYVTLVRVAIVKANQEREEGKPPDLSHAENYLIKAKNV